MLRPPLTVSLTWSAGRIDASASAILRGNEPSGERNVNAGPPDAPASPTVDPEPIARISSPRLAASAAFTAGSASEGVVRSAGMSHADPPSARAREGLTTADHKAISDSIRKPGESRCMTLPGIRVRIYRQERPGM